MAEGRSVARRVLELKERLSCAQDTAQIIETLKVLQDLDISLDILVETGIGKTVNSFRKHATAGNVAKNLVKQWKKLISPENKSGQRGRKQNTEKDRTKSSVSKEIKPSDESKAPVLASRSSSSAPISKKLNKHHTCSEKTKQSRDSESQKEGDNKEHSRSGSKHAAQGTNPQAKESDFKDRTSIGSKKVSEKQHSSVTKKDSQPLKERPSKDASRQGNPEHGKKPKQEIVIKSKAKLSSDEELEPPTMSFEYYLNYDQVTKNRKRKACSAGERPKRSSGQMKCSLPQKTSKFSLAKEGEEDLRSEGDQSETPNKKTKVASLQDLLNTPLPKFLTGISISSPPYAADFKAVVEPVVEAPQQSVFQRCLHYMNSASVCFKIILITFIEESDDLWKKHCQRDFKNESLLEYESWREMYLRLFNQREEKLKILTKNIISAQSEKPKGRQVKMAYMTSAAKPPRNIRRQQEIHGTAGPLSQLHPIEKCRRSRIPESGDRNNTSSNPVCASNSSSSSSSTVTQDGKKPIKKIAPIMKKTLKTLKSRVGRR
ncbi:transcription elongation factor B polypeptide 3 [Patagioenas fasciata monilis]|uniref:Transcription elongation factor B polypeptide 3 n=1 Tax=Patagioenas fasciata monilis TaxID=372326 RepID=A0A1V4JMM5_PATFA|nr:transcription elongation factor B polypeptide 3 [Patagioenas fasciata monilis]